MGKLQTASPYSAFELMFLSGVFFREAQELENGTLRLWRQYLVFAISDAFHKKKARITAGSIDLKKITKKLSANG